MLTAPVEGENKSSSGSSLGASEALEERIKDLQEGVAGQKRKSKPKKKDKETKKQRAAEAGLPAAASSAAPAAAAAMDLDKDEPTAQVPEPTAERTKPKKAIFKGDQAKLLILMLKQVLNLVQGMRDVQSILFDIVLLPKTCSLVQQCIIQGRRYSETTKQKKHGLGPPHLYVWGAIMNLLGESNDLVKAAYINYEKMSIAARNDLVKMCRCAKLFKEEQRKLVLTFGCGAEGQALRALVLPLIFGSGRCGAQGGESPSGLHGARAGGLDESYVDVS